MNTLLFKQLGKHYPENIRMVPDVWCVSRYVVFCPRIKVLCGASGGWANALIFCSVKKRNEADGVRTHTKHKIIVLT